MSQRLKKIALTAYHHIKRSVQKAKNYLKDLFNDKDFAKEFIIKVIECATAFFKFF